MIKKREIKATLEAMKAIRVPKIKDKALRNQFITIHLKLLGEEKKYEAEIEDAQIVFLSSYGDEQAEVSRLQESLRGEMDRQRQAEIIKEIESHAEYLEAVKAFNERAAEMGRAVVEVEAIDMAAFMEEYEEQGYDPGVVEGLYPLFGN